MHLICVCVRACLQEISIKFKPKMDDSRKFGSDFIFHPAFCGVFSSHCHYHHRFQYCKCICYRIYWFLKTTTVVEKLVYVKNERIFQHYYYYYYFIVVSVLPFQIYFWCMCACAYGSSFFRCCFLYFLLFSYNLMENCEILAMK